jgi:hypothetical protein
MDLSSETNNGCSKRGPSKFEAAMRIGLVLVDRAGHRVRTTATLERVPV